MFLITVLALISASAIAVKLKPVDKQLDPDLFLWTDTCNAYVLRDGEAALLIDLGDGSVLDHLAEIGVKHVEYVLFTHHHREQCQGSNRLSGSGAKICAPEAEKGFFEHPEDYRKMKVRLDDPFTVYGASYVRPPIQPIPIDRTFKSEDVFTWHGHELRCEETPGNSPGSMTYLLKHNSRWIAFSGDVMLNGATMHTWFDTEWDYGYGAGIQALQKSVSKLSQLDISCMLPSHGSIIHEPREQLNHYSAKLHHLEKLYVRGYGVEGASNAYQDKASTATAIKDIAQVSPHLFKFKRPDFWPNFGLILADNGHALVVDCGLLDEKFINDSLQGMRDKYGLKHIDAIIITHMHGDHFMEAPYLSKKWGSPIWALQNMADVCGHPEWFDYAASIQSYGKTGVEGIHFDRLFKSGETFEWEGYTFTVDWMPGQTEFALCLHGQIDGRKVAFTGDNIFGDPDDESQTGHEAVVAHNSAILEEGYIYSAEYLHRLKPDIMVGGHSFVMDHPVKFIERFRKWSYEMRDVFKSLSSEKDYRRWYDPYWVRAQPYRVSVRRGDSVEIKLNVRNFDKAKQRHEIAVRVPTGIRSEPGVITGEVERSAQSALPVRIRVDSEAQPGVYLIAFDVTLDARRYGEWFDAVVEVLP